MQSRRIIAPVFLVNAIHITWRDVTRTQLPQGEMAPHIDINAVGAFYAKGTLSRAHHRTCTLFHGVDQMDARRISRIRSGHAMNRTGALRNVQPLQKAPIAAVPLVRTWIRHAGYECLMA